MNDATLPILLGAGAVGGLLWHASRRRARAHTGTPGETGAAAPPAASPDRPARDASTASPLPATPAPSSVTASAPPASAPPEIRPPKHGAPGAAVASTPSPPPGRWIWPVETYNGRRSVITNPWSTREGRVHKGVDILFPRVPGDSATGRPVKYPPTVERWRSLVASLANGLDVDFLLTWIQHESGGLPCATGIPNKETGLFQSYHPHDDRHGATFEALRTACEPGKQTAYRPLTDAEQRLQVSTGIALVRACMEVATSTLKAIGAEWSTRDRYCLAKLVHALPAYVYRFPKAYADKHGRPPASWAEFRTWVRSLPDTTVIAIARAVRPWASVAQRDRLFGNAERTGDAVSHGHPRYVVPEGVRALAASDGIVWSASRMPRGFTVVIDHGALGYATFYTHLSSLLVAPTQRGASRERVYAGQPLGVIGADPMDPAGLPHLHFELWKGGPSDAIDPAPLMRWWEHISPSTPPPAVPSKPAPGSPPPPASPLGTSGPPVPSSSAAAPGSMSTTAAMITAMLKPGAPGVARNASLSYRPVGERGEPYPEWIRALDGKSGVYVIRELGPDGKPEIVYVGQSSAGRLYDTLTRHLQQWRRWKGFWRGQYGEGHDPGLTYDRGRVDVAVRITPASRALDEEARLIRRLRPRDNLIGQPEEVPF